MTESSDATPPGWIDPDEAGEWSEEALARAELRDGDRILRPASGTLTRRGRPPLDNPKRQVTLRLDGDLLDHLRATGPGWQSRINELLRKAVGV
ncbi:MAG: BrnA antitoxin family protein [Phenylobacterium sp.]|nr:BrnA antitoxin family protein [Phenylobacterium sp.]